MKTIYFTGDCGISLPTNHKICKACAQFNQCKVCKRHLRRARFVDATDTCESCHKKVAQKKQGATNVYQWGGNITNTTSERSLQATTSHQSQQRQDSVQKTFSINEVADDGNEPTDNVDIYINDTRSEDIRDILRSELQTKR